MEGTKLAKLIRRWRQDLPFFLWAVGVFAFFASAWVVAPMILCQLLLNMPVISAATLTVVLCVMLVVGAFKLYLPRVDPHDEAYQNLSNKAVIGELIWLSIWPLPWSIDVTRPLSKRIANKYPSQQ